MDMMQAQARLKDLSDDQLVQQMQMPDGTAPQFLVLTELKRRRDMRKGAEAQQAPNMPLKQKYAAEMSQGIGGVTPMRGYQDGGIVRGQFGYRPARPSYLFPGYSGNPMNPYAVPVPGRVYGQRTFDDPADAPLLRPEREPGVPVMGKDPGVGFGSFVGFEALRNSRATPYTPIEPSLQDQYGLPDGSAAGIYDRAMGEDGDVIMPERQRPTYRMGAVPGGLSGAGPTGIGTPVFNPDAPQQEVPYDLAYGNAPTPDDPYAVPVEESVESPVYQVPTGLFPEGGMDDGLNAVQRRRAARQNEPDLDFAEWWDENIRSRQTGSRRTQQPEYVPGYDYPEEMLDEGYYGSPEDYGPYEFEEPPAPAPKEEPSTSPSQPESEPAPSLTGNEEIDLELLAGAEAGAEMTEGASEDYFAAVEEKMRNIMEGADERRQSAINYGLMEAGLGIMASDSPYALQAVGEGGLPALKGVRDAMRSENERETQFLPVEAEIAAGRTSEARARRDEALTRRGQDMDQAYREAELSLRRDLARMDRDTALEVARASAQAEAAGDLDKAAEILLEAGFGDSFQQALLMNQGDIQKTVNEFTGTLSAAALRMQQALATGRFGPPPEELEGAE